jgi:hypothetical protein
MLMSLLRTLVLSSFLAAGVPGQVLDVIPERVRPGENIEFVFRNLTGTTMRLPYTCFVIADCWMNPLFPPCAPSPFTMEPGAELRLRWDTRDLNRVPFPPGCYWVWKDYYEGSHWRRVARSFVIEVSNTADLRMLDGGARIGRTAWFQVDNQWQAGKRYLFGLSFAQGPLIRLADGRLLPLRFDPLFVASQQPSPVFVAFTGTLDPQGRTLAGFVIPNDTRLVGASLLAAYVTLPGAGAPTSVEYISGPLPFTVQV